MLFDVFGCWLVFRFYLPIWTLMPWVFRGGVVVWAWLVVVPCVWVVVVGGLAGVVRLGLFWVVDWLLDISG